MTSAEISPSRPDSGVRVVALIGPAQAGKTTVASQLVSTYQHTRFRMADKLKAMIGLLGCERRHIDGEDKELPLNILCGKTTRHAMQTLGTDWARRLIHPDIWAVQTANTIAESNVVQAVVDDVRFPNELSALKHRFDVVTIRVWNSKKRYPLIRMWLARRAWGRTITRFLPFLFIHESEAWWKVLPADHEIDNIGTLDDLYRSLDDILSGQSSRVYIHPRTRLVFSGNTRTTS